MPIGSVTLLLSAGLAGTALAICLLALQAARNPLNKIPGPFYARFTNIPLKLAVVSGRRLHYIHALHDTYGSFVRISPGEVAVADPQAVKHIHGVASGFVKTEWYIRLVDSPRLAVFTMSDPKAHAARRRLLSRPFSKSHLRQHWEGAVMQKARLAVFRIQSKAIAAPLDILQWWTFMASDVSAHLMFGQSFETLEHGKVGDYIRKLQSALMGGGIRAELPLIASIGKRLPIKLCQDLWLVNDYLMDYGEVAVDNMRAEGGNANIFAGMMKAAEKGEQLDDMDVQIEAQSLIVAGTDTTSTTLTFLIWAVLSRPDLQREIEGEVRGLPDGFRDADVEQLELLNAVIEETLRLYGAAPGSLPRLVPAGGVTWKGLYLPGGTVVSTQAYTCHRDPALFPDPLEFLPARWMESKDGRHRVSDAARQVYAPFGAGARTCLGIHLAYMELRLASAEFFRKCIGARLASSVTPQSMELENYFLIAPAEHKCEITLSSNCQ